MMPPSEPTKLEDCGDFVEYVGSGKLKDKKVLITGGEYVSEGKRGRCVGAIGCDLIWPVRLVIC